MSNYDEKQLNTQIATVIALNQEGLGDDVDSMLQSLLRRKEKEHPTKNREMKLNTRLNQGQSKHIGTDANKNMQASANHILGLNVIVYKPDLSIALVNIAALHNPVVAVYCF